MTQAIIAAGVTAGLYLALGLNGCAPGTVIWTIPKTPSLATNGGSGGQSPPNSLPSHLTDKDREQLTQLLEKLK